MIHIVLSIFEVIGVVICLLHTLLGFLMTSTVLLYFLTWKYKWVRVKFPKLCKFYYLCIECGEAGASPDTNYPYCKDCQRI